MLSEQLLIKENLKYVYLFIFVIRYIREINYVSFVRHIKKPIRFIGQKNPVGSHDKYKKYFLNLILSNYWIFLVIMNFLKNKFINLCNLLHMGIEPKYIIFFCNILKSNTQTLKSWVCNCAYWCVVVSLNSTCNQLMNGDEIGGALISLHTFVQKCSTSPTKVFIYSLLPQSSNY